MGKGRGKVKRGKIGSWLSGNEHSKRDEKWRRENGPI